MYWQSMYDGMELVDVPQVPDDDMLEPVMLSDATSHKGTINYLDSKVHASPSSAPFI